MGPLEDMRKYDDERRQEKFAKTEIHSAESVVNEAERKNFDVEAPLKLLEKARAMYDSNEFQKAVELSLECKRLVYSQMTKTDRRR